MQIVLTVRDCQTCVGRTDSISPRMPTQFSKSCVRARTEKVSALSS